MKKILALLLALAMLAALCACGDTGSKDVSATEQTSATEESATAAEETESAAEKTEPADDGEHVLNILCGDQQLTLDPLESANGSSDIVARAIYATLWNYYSDDPNTLKMELASSYELNDDQTELKIVLRDDIFFADGTPITAEDVLWTYEYYLGTAQGPNVENIDFENSYAEDDQNLVLKLVEASPVTLDSLTSLFILSKAAFEEGGADKMANDPNFSGAYIVDTFETGEPIVLVKNPHYYDAENLYYDKVVLTCISNENSRYLTFQGGGDVDYDIVTINSNDYVVLNNEGDTPDAHLQSTAMQALVYMAFNTVEYPQFADVNLRAAVAHAVDWETIVTGICGENYTLAKSCLLPHMNWAFLETGTYEYDPELAAEYLEKAGYAPGEFSFTCRIADEDFNAEICEAVQAYLSMVGINMSISMADSPTVRSEIRSNTIEFGIGKSMGSSDPYSIVRSRVSSTPANLYHMVSVPELGETYLQDRFDEACFAVDGQDYRAELYQEVQQLMFDNYACYPLYETTNFYGASDSMGDFAAACETSMGALCMRCLTNDLVASW